MQAILINKVHLDFVTDKGERVSGWKFFYLKNKRNPPSSFLGYEVLSTFLSDSADKKLLDSLSVIMPGDHMELIYDCDGKKNYLVEIVGHDSVFDFSKSI